MPKHIRTPPWRRPVPVPPWLIVASVIGLVVLGGGTVYAAATPTYTDQCVRTVKTNGGIILDCDPLSAPESPAASPTLTTPPATSSSPPTTTTAPATSTSATSTLLTNCFSQLAACGYPTLASTGVPAGTALTVITGNLNITTAGAVIDGREIRGCVSVRAANVTIRNSKIIGQCFYTLETYAAGGPTTVEHVEISCVNGSGSGLSGPNFHGRWVNIHDCENASEINAGSSIEDSYLSSREGSSTAHGDDIQSQGGNNVIIRHNTFAGLNPITSSIITNPQFNNGWIVEGNFLSAGAFTLYCPEQGTNFVVRNNRFYPAKLTNDPHSAAYGLTDACNHAGITWSGNYLDSNLSTVGASA